MAKAQKVVRLPSRYRNDSGARAVTPMRTVPKHLQRPEADIGDLEKRTIRNLVAFDGAEKTAKSIGICEATLMRVLAGYYGSCTTEVRQKIIAFFSEKSGG